MRIILLLTLYLLAMLVRVAFAAEGVAPPRPELRQTQEEQAGQTEQPEEYRQHPPGYRLGPVRIPPRQAEGGK